jgi:Ca-activated chloride channel family protein
MILLTDGKDNPAPIAGTTPPDPLEAAKVAATMGIKIYTVGASGGGAPARQDAVSLLFQSRAEVDEPMLKNIAQITGGRYFRATDADSLVTIYDEIAKLEKRVTGERTYQDNIQAATIAMEAGLALLLIELVLSCTRFRRIP